MKFRALGLAAATAAIALSAFAGTVSAAPATGTVFVAHGIPGAVVDVCVNRKEVKSNFRYGQQFVLSNVPVGTYKVQVFPANRLACRGPLIIGRTVTVTDGLNATAVARLVNGAPRLQIFANDTTIPTAGNATITVRHTASAPTVAVWLNGGAAPALPSLASGASAGPVELEPNVYSWWVSNVGGYRPVIGPAIAKLGADTAYQIYAVGTSPANYRFIVIGQPGQTPS